MNRFSSYIHDLNNKLTIIYGALRSYKNGKKPPEENHEAVKARIQDIIHALHSAINFEQPYQLDFIQIAT